MTTISSEGYATLAKAMFRVIRSSITEDVIDDIHALVDSGPKNDSLTAWNTEHAVFQQLYAKYVLL